MLVYILGVRRTVALHNMRHAGIGNEREIRLILRRLYRNVGRIMVDVLRASHEMPPFVIDDPNTVATFFSPQRGGIAVAAHLGNWELLAQIFAHHSTRLHVLAKPMRNPLTERWLFRKRSRGGVAPMHPGGAYRKILRALRQNEYVAILIDQSARSHGEIAPFLGKEALTTRTVAGLLHHMQCTVVGVYATLEPDMTYRIHFETPAEPLLPRENAAEFVSSTMAIHNDMVSRWILAYPDQWFGWFHRRFKGALSY